MCSAQLSMRGRVFDGLTEMWRGRIVIVRIERGGVDEDVRLRRECRRCQGPSWPGYWSTKMDDKRGRVCMKALS